MKSWGTHLVGCEVGWERYRGARITEEGVGGGNSTAMDQMVQMAVTEKQTRQSTYIFEVVKKSTKNEPFQKSTDEQVYAFHILA